MAIHGEQNPRLELKRAERRPDGTLGGKVPGPWAGWDLMEKADDVAALLAAVAIGLSAGSLFRGQSVAFTVPGFVAIAPLVGAGMFIALVAMFLERERHGVARIIFAIGATVLAISGVYFSGRVALARVVFFYWVPAVLAIAAAVVLSRGHKLEQAVDVHRRTLPPRRDR